MQNYHEVWVRSERYRGYEALTYSSDSKLTVGNIVTVPLKRELVLGVVVRKVSKPRFATKPIAEVLALPPLPASTIRLMHWLLKYYPSPIGVITQLFLPIKIAPTNSGSKPAEQKTILAPTKPETALTQAQRTVLSSITQADTYLLHGRTGSGKTRIYIELALRTVASDRSVLILCPEIGLTSQLAANFKQVFGSAVVVLHSQLTPKQRQQAWTGILTATQPVVVVGPRSALFSPIQDLGLIVVDEAHDPAYKQEQPPYYQALRVASQLRELSSAALVLGSATPAVADYYLALQRHKSILRLDALAVPNAHKSSYTLVDLKDRQQFGRSQHLSLPLIHAIEHSLERGEQALLYLNRRGTARVVLCEHCGWQAVCPNCDVPLIYHADRFNMQCHVCGHAQAAPISCPACGQPSITFRSFGTKAIAAEAHQLFPEVRILRLDTDSAKSERLEQQYEQILEGQIDILVGTQVLTKGLDLPKLSTLGIILADSSLYVPDYTAQERTYQLLTQVLGRVGRGHTSSQAIIQTYHPKSPLLEAAIADDWQSFYDTEINERQAYFYPPFSHVLKLTCKRTTSKAAETSTQKLKQALEASHTEAHIDGPAPSFHQKVAGLYRWQLVVKSRNRSTLLGIIAELPSGWSYDLDPADLL